MKSRSLVGLLLVCASPVAAQRTRNVIVVPGQMTQVVTDTMGTVFDIPYPAAAVYRALLAVYAELKVPAEVQDTAVGRVESNVFYRSGSLAGKQISTYLGCGDGMTGPYADQYRVYMVAMSTVGKKDAENSTLRSVLLGGAVAVAEGARQPMACESTGRLEIRIQQMVLKKLTNF